jgi:hypothetical protein
MLRIRVEPATGRRALKPRKSFLRNECCTDT